VLALFVLEEIKHPFPFHQSGNKIEFGLAVLQRHVKSLIGALESTPEVTKSELLKYLRDDFRYRLILKNSTIGCLSQEPEPRHHLSLIIGKLGILTGLGKLAHKSVEVAFAAIAQRHVHRNGLADYRFKPDRSLL
jgi:hypothetical protein